MNPLRIGYQPKKVLNWSNWITFPVFLYRISSFRKARKSPNFHRSKAQIYFWFSAGMTTLMWKKFWPLATRPGENWKKANFEGGIWSVIFPKSGKEVPHLQVVDQENRTIQIKVHPLTVNLGVSLSANSKHKLLSAYGWVHTKYRAQVSEYSP